MKSIYDVIVRPVVSEKSAAIAELARKYVFEVRPSAAKTEIREAVERVFGVKVKGVHTMIVHGKTKRVGRFEKKRTNWKKAIVSLAEGHKIDIFQP